MTTTAGEPTENYNKWLAQAFPRLPKDTLIDASKRLMPGEFEAGEVIIVQDDPPGLFYVVASGEVEVRRRGKDGQERILATLGPGEFFGEMGLVADTERSATVQAKTDVEALALSWDYFIMMIESSEEAWEDFSTIVSARAAEA